MKRIGCDFGSEWDSACRAYRPEHPEPDLHVASRILTMNWGHAQRLQKNQQEYSPYPFRAGGLALGHVHRSRQVTMSYFPPGQFAVAV